MLSRYLDALAVRTHAQAEVDELAATASIPVVNALTDEEHPLQALADLQTIRERLGGLDGVRVAWIGDGSNVCASLADACALLGVEFVLRLAGRATSRPASTTLRDPREAARGAHVLVTDVWTSMGQEAERERRARDLAPYALDEPARRSPTRTRSCSTACRRIPARRSPPTSSTARSRRCGTRRRTACTRPKALLALVV